MKKVLLFEYEFIRYKKRPTEFLMAKKPDKTDVKFIREGQSKP